MTTNLPLSGKRVLILVGDIYEDLVDSIAIQSHSEAN